MKKKLFIGLGSLLGLFFILTLGFILKPVPIVTEDEALVEEGIVESISEGGTNDVLFILANSETRFYINRGLESGLDLGVLKEKLIGQKVVFKYPKYWTPLDWNDKIKHVSKVEFGNEIIFDEFEKR
ncbi:MAG: hypothetical protein R6U85_06210 [Salinivirgaceae bacterium]